MPTASLLYNLALAGLDSIKSIIWDLPLNKKKIRYLLVVD